MLGLDVLYLSTFTFEMKGDKTNVEKINKLMKLFFKNVLLM